MKPEHDDALVEQVARALLRNMLDPDYDEAKMLALVALALIRTTDAARIASLESAVALVRKELNTQDNGGGGWMAEFERLAARATLRSSPDAVD